MRLLVAAGVLVAFLLAGCAGDARDDVASSVSPPETLAQLGPVQSGRTSADLYKLRVEVVGAVAPAGTLPGRDGSDRGSFTEQSQQLPTLRDFFQPIPEAVVGVVDPDGDALAGGTADGGGVVEFRLARGQTVQLVGHSDPWTVEISDPIHIGAATSGAENCANRPNPCLVTANGTGARYYVDGPEAGVLLVLFPRTAEFRTEANLGARLVTPGGTLPTGGDPWAAFVLNPHPLPPVQDMYLDRLTAVSASLEWTNQPPNLSDLGLGLGCSEGAPDVAVGLDDDAAGLAELGTHRLEAALELDDGCERVRYGAIVDTATTGGPYSLTVSVALTGLGPE